MYDREGGRGRSDRFGADMDTGPKPVKVGDEIDVTVDAVAARGDGLAKKDGFVIFINGAKMGDRVRIKITDVKQRYAVGQLLGPAGGVGDAAAAEESKDAEDSIA